MNDLILIGTVSTFTTDNTKELKKALEDAGYTVAICDDDWDDAGYNLYIIKEREKLEW